MGSGARNAPGARAANSGALWCIIGDYSVARSSTEPEYPAFHQQPATAHDAVGTGATAGVAFRREWNQLDVVCSQAPPPRRLDRLS
jgi:hypothetical protein